MFRRAVLIIHGFAGGTYDQEYLSHRLELEKDFDVFQFTLPGHDTNLSKVKYEEWIDRSEEMLKWLIDNGYKKIYLVGHSMGGVIATYLTTKYKEVKKLVLVAPAYQYLEINKSDVDVKGTLKKSKTLVKDYGVKQIFSRALKFKFTTVIEFTSLIKKLYDYPKQISCPVLILQGLDDNLVPKTSSEYVYQNVKSTSKSLVYLNGVTHDVFRSDKKDEVTSIIKNFLKNNETYGIIEK